jgi:hypothetical protein
LPILAADDAAGAGESVTARYEKVQCRAACSSLRFCGSCSAEGSWGFRFFSFYSIWQVQRHLIACAAALSSEKEKGNIATIYCCARGFRGRLEN